MVYSFFNKWTAFHNFEKKWISPAEVWLSSMVLVENMEVKQLELTAGLFKFDARIIKQLILMIKNYIGDSHLEKVARSAPQASF